MMPYKRVGKYQEDAQDLACQGLKLLPPDGDLCLICRDANIAEASCILLPIRELLYGKVLDCIQFYYTGDQLGAYVAPGSINIDFTTLS